LLVEIKNSDDKNKIDYLKKMINNYGILYLFLTVDTGPIPDGINNHVLYLNKEYLLNLKKIKKLNIILINY